MKRATKRYAFGGFFASAGSGRTMTWRTLKCCHSSTTISTMYMTVHKHRVGRSAQLPNFIYQTSKGNVNVSPLANEKRKESMTTRSIPDSVFWKALFYELLRGEHLRDFFYEVPLVTWLAWALLRDLRNVRQSKACTRAMLNFCFQLCFVYYSNDWSSL